MGWPSFLRMPPWAWLVTVDALGVQPKRDGETEYAATAEACQPSPPPTLHRSKGLVYTEVSRQASVAADACAAFIRISREARNRVDIL